MKNNLIKIVACIAIFILTIVITSQIINEGKADLTTEMRVATLPVVSISTSEGLINEMFGYTMDMEIEFVRDSITQIDSTRHLMFQVDTKDSDIESISYELRTLTGERLIEMDTIEGYDLSESILPFNVYLKDLIEENQEYSFQVIIKLQDGRTANYYTRIVETDDYYMDEKVAFVKDFSTKIFDKEAAEELTKYLESSYLGDNSTFNYVNIHSSFDQVTWGDLQVEKIGETKIHVIELQEETASLEVSYAVKDSTGREDTYYFVTENFRVRYTTDRVYLLDYERRMEQQFNLNEDSFANNKCLLGITSSDIDLVESDAGEIVTFVNNHQLYSIMPNENKVAKVFAYYDTVEDDSRNTNQRHEIKVLSCDEAGNMYFMVYGYHNRGIYEGKVGIQVFYYSSASNTVEEKVFLPYEKSPEMLIYEVDRLTYLNKNIELYLLMDNILVAVDVLDGTITEMTGTLLEGSFTVSNSNETVAWSVGESLYNSDTLTMINLNTKGLYSIEASAGTSLLPLGFMGEDLIYGEAYNSDVVENSAKNIIFPMHQINIKGERGDILMSYEAEGYYVLDLEIIDNQINLERVTWNERTETYEEASDDQIVNNTSIAIGENTVEEVVSETYKKQVQLVINEKIDEGQLLFLTPKEVLYEGNRKIEQDENEEHQDSYYVYVQGDVAYISNVAGKAVRYATEHAGTVLNGQGEYAWYAGNRFARNQIMAIKEKEIAEEQNALITCLNTILENEGIIYNTEYDVKAGKAVFDILGEQLSEREILDLSGCELDDLLFYVNKDIPVLVMLGNGEAVLVTGFNDYQVVIFDPIKGELYKTGKTAASSWFEENGSIFISYI